MLASGDALTGCVGVWPEPLLTVRQRRAFAVSRRHSKTGPICVNHNDFAQFRPRRKDRDSVLDER